MGRNLLLLFVLVILPGGLSFGQKTVSVSVTLSPILSYTNYSYRYFFPESDGQVVEPVFLNGKHWATGYSAGASVLYAYAPGWSVLSGIWFQQVTTRQDRQPTAGEGTVALHNRVIRVPLLLTYSSSTQRLSPYFSVGLLTDLPMLSRVVVTRVGESTQHLRLEPISTSPVFHGLLGAGIQYKLSSHYTLLAQPIWTYSFGRFGGASTHDASFELTLLTQLAYSF